MSNQPTVQLENGCKVRIYEVGEHFMKTGFVVGMLQSKVMVMIRHQSDPKAYEGSAVFAPEDLQKM